MIGRTYRTGTDARAVRKQTSACRAHNNNQPDSTESLPQVGVHSPPDLHMGYTQKKRVGQRCTVMRVNTTAGLDDRSPWAWENSVHAGIDVEKRPEKRLSRKSSGDASANSLFVAPGWLVASDKCTGCPALALAHTEPVDAARAARARSSSSTWRTPYFGSYQDGEHGEDERAGGSVRRTSWQ